MRRARKRKVPPVDSARSSPTNTGRWLRGLAWLFLLLGLGVFSLAALLTYLSNRDPVAADAWRNSVSTEGVVFRKWVQPSPSGNEMARSWIALRFWTGTAQPVEVSAELDSPRTWRNLAVGDGLMLRYQPAAPDRVRLIANWNPEFIGDEERVVLFACGVLMLSVSAACWVVARKGEGTG